MSRPFPLFRVFENAIVADEPVGQHNDLGTFGRCGGAFLVAESLENPALADFIVSACNQAGDYAEATANLVAAKADYAAARATFDRCLAGADAAEPEAPGFGWYAGLALDKLSVGPLSTFEAALEAGRHEHGASATIYVIEAAEKVADVEPFALLERVGRVLEWIEKDNPDAIIPPLRAHHEDDLADRLNAAVRGWLAEHGIKPITGALGPARQVFAAIPHEVESVTTTRVHDARRVAKRVGGGVAFADEISPKPVRILADEVDPWPATVSPIVEVMAPPPAEPFVFEDAAPRPMQPIRSGHCDGCAKPTDCSREGCVRKLARLRTATFVKGSTPR